MFKSIVRIFLIFVSFVIIVCVIASLIFKVAFPERRLKKMAIDGIRGFFSREATIGKISIDFLSGIEISDFSLSEYQDLKSGTFFSAKYILLKIRFIPLMRQSIIVREFIVSSPKINLIKKTDESFNFDSLIKYLPHRQHRILPYFLLISDFKISNGEVFVKIEKSNFKEIIFKNIDVNAKNISLISPFEITILGDLLHKKSKFHINGKCTVNLKDKVLDVSVTKIIMNGLLLNISGKITEFTNNPQLTLQVQGNSKVLEHLLEIFGKPSNLQFGENPETNFTIIANHTDLKIKSQ